MQLKKTQSGFTLVELSIVLVIIGLIIASVLVGQDLIRGAELRATVTQFNTFNAGVAAFKSKYGSLPGDGSAKTNFGIGTTVASGCGALTADPADGNGNNVLEGSDGTIADLNKHNCEYVLFWHHLGSKGAAMIPGTFDGVDLATATTGAIDLNLPKSKVGDYWSVANSGNITNPPYMPKDINIYVLGTVQGTNGDYTLGGSLNALDSSDIDRKIDDGSPLKGVVLAIADSIPGINDAGTAGSRTCIIGMEQAYNTAAADSLCVLTMRIAF